MERYCSCVSKLITFRTSHEKGFLVFGVSNAKYLAFGTSNGNALKVSYFFTRLLDTIYGPTLCFLLL